MQIPKFEVSSVRVEDYRDDSDAPVRLSIDQDPYIWLSYEEVAELRDDLTTLLRARARRAG